jgi:hypothetical protein
VRNAVNQTGFQRINSVWMHDRNGLGRVHDGKGCWRRRRWRSVVGSIRDSGTAKIAQANVTGDKAPYKPRN